MAAKIFISCSEQDYSFLAELEKYLSVLKRLGKVEIWHGRNLDFGEDWDGITKQELEAADVILLLVSANFIATDYIWDVEIKRAMERHRAGSAVVIPIILRPCDWMELPFGALSALPDKAIPISTWKNRDAAWLNVVEGLKRVLADRSTVTQPVRPQARHNLGRRNSFFTGREQELALLAQNLEQKAPVAIIPVEGQMDVYVIQGLGGIGKSQLALEYAFRHLSDYEVIWWVRAETSQTLMEDVAALGKMLKLAGSKPEELSQAALKWMGSNRNWLVVLDNAPSPQEVKEWIPSNHDGHLLITTRHRFGWDNLANSLDMPTMTREEGTAFLLRRLGLWETATEAHRQAAGTLTDELGGLPLALEQAASYMKELVLPLEEYIRLYRSEGLALMAREESRPSIGGYDKTVLTTWSLSYERVETRSPMAVVVLNLLAFLDPDQIPRLLLWEWRECWLDGGKNWARHLSYQEAYDRALRELNRFALIRLDEQQKNLSLHRLVGDVTRERLGEEANRHYVALALAILSKAYEIDDRDMPVSHEARRLYPHALAVARHGERLGVELGQVSFLYDRCAAYWKSQGAYGQARELLEHALAIEEKNFGFEHPKVATRLNNLGGVLQAQGDLSGARRHFARALAIGEKTLGPEHSAVATRLNNLGLVLQAQGDLSGARRSYERALAISEKILGPEHPEVAVIFNNLGGVLCVQGDLSGARRYYERALAIWEKALGPEHPEVATSINNLGVVVQAQGDFSGARRLYERALAIGEKTLGPEHPDVAKWLNNLGDVLQSQGDLSGARRYIERALAIGEKTLGPEHPDVAIWLKNLGGVLQAQGDLFGAQRFYERALAILRSKLPPGHPHISTVEKNLARQNKIPLWTEKQKGAASLTTQKGSSSSTTPLNSTEILRLAFHLVRSRYAQPELLESLESTEFRAALNRARLALDVATPQQVLKKLEPQNATPPSPLWMAYMETQNVDSMNSLNRESFS
ncbi:MAG: toll/interleukin-1 receptor domain-containing protein [Magnetococcales bacterium]|nr:toll/interleukin-1 receptor domain-containing protein [Magnetococcales bacterium]